MSFTAAVAAGQRAVGSLQQACANRATAVDGDEVVLRRHQDVAVAWSSTCRWIDASDDGSVLVVLDGRLHNLWSPTVGQAELVRRRYLARGREVARELLGDFVLIVLDRRSATLLVARDPVGVRPWYTASAGRLHAGATDLATLAMLPWVDTTVNEQQAIEYLAFFQESRGETLCRGIGTLQPGQTWHVADGRARTTTHHTWEVQPDLEIPWEAASDRCRAVLDEVVGDRLRVSGPATSQLSGGLDSSSVVGTLARLGRDDLVVGRLIFDGPRADERRYSDAVIDHWGLRAVSAAPWVPTIEESTALTTRFRRPVPPPHFTMFASLHESLLAEGRADSLTGIGGDDAFVAMGIGPRAISAVQLRQAPVLADLARRTLRGPREAWAELVRPTLSYVARPWRGGRSPGWVTEAARAQADLRRLTGRRPARVTGVVAIDERLDNLTSGYEASILETSALVNDWTGARQSHPYLDPRFIGATYGLDPWWPARGDHNRALQVHAYSDRLPPVVAGRRSKAEFSELFWPRLLDERVLADVRRGPLAQTGWLDLAGFDGLVVNAKRGMANAAIPLFRCVSIDQWLRTQ